MKKSLFTTGLLLLVFFASAQQTSLYQMYFTNRMLINPAQTGFDTVAKVHFLHRNQWTATPGAPMSNVLTGQGNLLNNRMGIGATAFFDQVDITRRMQFMANYAYKIRLPKDVRIDIGVGAGVVNQYVDFSAIRSQNVTDPALLASQNNRLVFDANAGINVYFYRANVGFAVQHLPGLKAKYFGESASFSLERAYLVYASYKQPLLKKQPLTLEPIVLMRKSKSTKPQVEATLVLDYKKWGWLAVNFRSQFGMGVSAGVHLFKWVDLGYGYEFPMFATAGRTGGSHEVTLAININHRKESRGFEFDTLRLLTDIERIDQKLEAIKLLQEESRNLNATQDSLIDRALNRPVTPVDSLTKKLKELDLEMALIKVQLESFDYQMKQILLLRMAKKPYDNVLKKGVSYKLTRIFFSNAAFEFAGKSKAELDDLVSVLQEFSNLSIKIFGHTDNRGSYSVNMELSRKRAKMVYDYLVNAGISTSRLSYEGYGPDMPLTENETEAGRGINRRVEFVIIKD